MNVGKLRQPPAVSFSQLPDLITAFQLFTVLIYRKILIKALVFIHVHVGSYKTYISIIYMYTVYDETLAG